MQTQAVKPDRYTAKGGGEDKGKQPGKWREQKAFHGIYQTRQLHAEGIPFLHLQYLYIRFRSQMRKRYSSRSLAGTIQRIIRV